MAATQHPSRATEQAEFAAYFSKYTGLSPKVVAHWLLAEQPLGSAASANSNDWLNVEAGASGAGVGSSEEKRIGAMSPNKAARATAEWIEKNQPSILASAGHSEATQYAAIERSGFAESHYAGGLASAGSTADISFLTEALKEGGQLLEGPLGPTTEGEKELGEGLGSVEKKAEGIVGGVEGAGKAAMITDEHAKAACRLVQAYAACESISAGVSSYGERASATPTTGWIPVSKLEAVAIQRDAIATLSAARKHLGEEAWAIVWFVVLRNLSVSNYSDSIGLERQGVVGILRAALSSLVKFWSDRDSK